MPGRGRRQDHARAVQLQTSCLELGSGARWVTSTPPNGGFQERAVPACVSGAVMAQSARVACYALERTRTRTAEIEQPKLTAPPKVVRKYSVTMRVSERCPKRYSVAGTQ